MTSQVHHMARDHEGWFVRLAAAIHSTHAVGRVAKLRREPTMDYEGIPATRSTISSACREGCSLPAPAPFSPLTGRSTTSLQAWC